MKISFNRFLEQRGTAPDSTFPWPEPVRERIELVRVEPENECEAALDRQALERLARELLALRYHP